MQFDVCTTHVLKGSFDSVAVSHVCRSDPAVRMESASKLSICLFDFGFLRSMSDTQNLVPIAGDEGLFNLLHLVGNQNCWAFE